MVSVPTAINASVTISPRRRPSRSMYAPRTIAPSGRIRYPTPNVISDNMSEANSELTGKNVFAMYVA